MEVPDLSPHHSRESVGAVIAETYPDLSDAALANYTGQMWALRSRIVTGDLLAMPMKTTKQIALGRVTEGYKYLADQDDPNQRHVVSVDWQITDLPRSAVKQDLLFSLGSALSIFAPSKNHAVARLEQLLVDRIDPGQVPYLAKTTISGQSQPQPALEDDVDEPELHTDIDEVARDQITARIAEQFAGHELADLVIEILRVEGFTCTPSPPGRDGGIDIIAGRGILGMDAPKIIAQVKSGGQIGDPVVSQLHGVLSTQGADQGLLVAWGGLSRPARDSLRNHQLKIRVWEAADVVDAVLATYDRLPEEIRTRIPLKRVWMLTDS